MVRNFGVKSNVMQHQRLVCVASLLITAQVVLLVVFVHFRMKNQDLVVSKILNVQSIKIQEINQVQEDELQNDKDDLINKIKESSGRGLEINFGDKKHGENTRLTFDYKELTIPPKIQDLESSRGKHRSTNSSNKYVFVHSEYTEQMSMSMLSVLSLCGQAQFGARKVVRPFIHNGRFSSKQSFGSLGILFDLKHLDRLLEESGYSPMVDKQEYDEVCKPTDPNHVTIHFLYIGDVTKNWNKAHFKMTGESYDSIFEKTKSKGWTECSFLDKNMGRSPSSKQFCINPTIITDWKVLERDIVGGEKCLNIFLWRGIGGGNYRSYFTENDLKFSHDAIQFALKPSEPIQREVARFKNTFLPGRFIALYIRAEFVLVPHHYNFDYLKKCIDVMVEAIEALKASSGITSVYVASDMSKYASAALINYVGKAKLKHNPFPDIHQSLVSRVGGMVYNYNASSSEITDRGAIALVDLTLLTHAQHLITAGRENMSSFLRWVIGTFLANHREDKELWSKISVCGV